jgi:DnaB-like helicase C terminal domain
VTETVLPTQLEAGWLAVEQQAPLRYHRPLSDAFDRLVREAQSNRRIDLGITPIDAETQGIGPGHLAIVVGYSHSGKTLLTLNTLVHNRTKRLVVFTPDETAPLVLTKLAALMFETSPRELDIRVRADDPVALRMLRETIEDFPHLVIHDQPLTPKVMRRAYEETCEVWGDDADLVVLDYLDLLQAGEHLASKADAVKTFTSEHDVPLLVLHQTSRSAGTNGRPMRIDSGNFGGETWATFQFGVWRKRYAIEHELGELYRKQRLTDWEADRVLQLQRDQVIHARSVTVNLNKNKRPGGQLIEEGIDFDIDACGQLVPLVDHRYLHAVGDAHRRSVP